VKKTVVSEQFAFLDQYSALLARLPQEARRLKELERSLGEAKAISEQHDKLVKARMEEQAELEMKLEDARKSTRQEMENVADLEGQLFRVLQTKARAEEANYRLEQQLRELETREGR
jgi:chromosome segregation ATPase